ncbi:hypothetical protein AAG570_000083 [Ranatra chinensis]|uniref:Uncharacterized protein n=1 Tax=Ranatra chinensis TaxID=642074 RepID=A0ABD0YWP5_9HEMI
MMSKLRNMFNKNNKREITKRIVFEQTQHHAQFQNYTDTVLTPSYVTYTYERKMQPIRADVHFCQERGPRRQMLLKEVKEIMEKLEDLGPCVKPKCDVTKYPDFLGRKKDRYLPSYLKQPLITHVPLIEVRPTSDYRWLGRVTYPHIVFANVLSPQKTHSKAPWDKPRYASVEIRAGRNLYGCECTLRNGLQDNCPRSDCEGRPPCLQEVPECCPSTALLPQPDQTPIPQLVQRALADHPPQQFYYCCCPDQCRMEACASPLKGPTIC